MKEDSVRDAIKEIAEQYAKPGIYDNVSFEVYLAIEAVSRSYLCKLLDVPAKAKVPDKETDAMFIGRELHKYILEGEDAFNKVYAVGPQVNLTRTADKEKWAKFELENEGKICLRPKDVDMEKLKATQKAIKDHPAANDLLKDGLSEKTIIWKDHETGLLCKARPDKHPSSTEFVIADYKSTVDASEREFLKSVIKLKYFIQDPMYSEGMKILTGKDFLFAFIAVEKTEPYRTEVYTLSDDLRKVGHMEFHRLLRMEKRCREANHWPHFENAGAQELYPSKWFKDLYPEVFDGQHS